MPPCPCAFGAQTNLRLIPPSSCSSPLRNARFTDQILLSHAKTTTTSSIRITRIKAIEAVAQQQPLDLMDNKLKIAIVGFGNFGQFIAKTLVAQGHCVLAHSRSDYSNVATHLGVSFFSDLHDLCKQNPDVIVLCTSILSTESVLRAFPFEGLKKSTLFVDVLSVKEAPRNSFLRILPQEFDILCTHPMFGPQSGKHGWNGLKFVYDKVRIRDEDRCNRFLDVFDREDCDMVNMPCHEHDKWEAESQFITHFIGRVLQKLSLESTPINTKGYEALLELVRNTSGDSFDLFNGLFMYNKNALEQLERIDMAFESVKKQLFGELHSTLRKQLFGTEIFQEESNPAISTSSGFILQDDRTYRGEECNLRVGWPLRTVATGIVQSVDPRLELNGMRVGENNFKVYVTDVSDPDAELPRPHNNYCTTLGKLGQGSIIWPKEGLQLKH